MQVPERHAGPKKQPAAMATALATPSACTGAGLLRVELFPNWPKLLSPQVHTVPSLRTAAE